MMTYRLASLRAILTVSSLLVLAGCGRSLTIGPKTSDTQTVTSAPVSDQPAPNLEVIKEPQHVLERMAQGFQLPDIDDPVADEFAEWSASHPTYLANLFDRAEPFLAYIVNEVAARDLPMELALLPAIESAYRTTAVSRSRAVGVWQFVAATGREYGLEQNWWYDARRDPLQSTDAALTYLQRLYNRFDQDWFLTLAAYNYGQGNLARAIARNKRAGRRTDYFSLTLREETRRYVPKLIALRNIIRDPEKYGVELPEIPLESQISVIDVAQQQIDLDQLQAQTLVDARRFDQLNAAFLRWASPPAKATRKARLLLPTADPQVIAQVRDYLAQAPELSFKSHRVRQGDTLGGLARQYDVSVSAIRTANGLASNTIRLGKTLVIPIPGRASVAVNQTSNKNAEKERHEVVHGDTLWSIARHYSVSVSDLLSWNRITVDSPLQLGQMLRLLP